MNRTLYISIGNSDDRLSQEWWSCYVADVLALVDTYAIRTYGKWYSAPAEPYQNACLAVAVHDEELDELRTSLTSLRQQYKQDSIAWAEVPETEFL